MAQWVCQKCGAPFKRDRSGNRPIRYCSMRCYTEARKGVSPSGGFRTGHSPWNRGATGIHLSPSTEFKKGQPAINRAPVGTVKIRRRYSRSEGPRAWVKVAERNVWELRARQVWSSVHGPISKGMIVHHLDGDQLNDTLGNLALVDRAAHAGEHGRRRGGLNRKR